jgi:hypothetical protein
MTADRDFLLRGRKGIDAPIRATMVLKGESRADVTAVAGRAHVRLVLVRR